jgi:peptide deformylase
MIKEDGIGLAANQIGLDISLAIVYIQEIENPTFQDFLSQGYILINPEITFQSVETAIYKEGCLSIPTI